MAVTKATHTHLQACSMTLEGGMTSARHVAHTARDEAAEMSVCVCALLRTTRCMHCNKPDSSNEYVYACVCEFVCVCLCVCVCFSENKKQG